MRESFDEMIVRVGKLAKESEPITPEVKVQKALDWDSSMWDREEDYGKVDDRTANVWLF